MHCTDQQLKHLLIAHENATDVQAIKVHVEECPRCQHRLQELSGEGEWTNQLVGHLRQPELSELTIDMQPSELVSPSKGRTLVLQQPSDAIDDEVEFDPVAIDFLDEPSHPELLGRLGRYDVEALIGAGGMGVVLKGFDGDLHRPVAIKVMAPHLAHNAAARRRFAREAQAVAAVIHPHVIPIYNVEVEARLPYLVMSLIDGPSLQSYVDRHGALPVDVTLRIAQQIVLGLGAAHAQGLIHRDVKPANILLDGNALHVVLSDFGLARMVDDASMTRTGIVTGTPHYMSPEQACGDVIDCRSDLFSLGCVLWFMLTGRPPFRAATAMGVLNKICHANHGNLRELNPQVPRPLAKVIERLLHKSPTTRFQSAAEVEEALNKIRRDWQAGKFEKMKMSSVLTTVGISVAWTFVMGLLLLNSGRIGAYFYEIPSLTPRAGDQPTGIFGFGSFGNRPSAGSLAEQLRADPWYQEAAKASEDLSQLEVNNAEQLQFWNWIGRVYQEPQLSVIEMEATLEDMETELHELRELNQ